MISATKKILNFLATTLVNQIYMVVWDFPGGSDSKEYACSVGDPGLIAGKDRSPGEMNVTQSSVLAWRIL